MSKLLNFNLKTNGNINLVGTFKGSLEKPKIALNFESKNINIEEVYLETNGKFELDNNIIQLKIDPIC